MPPEDYLHPPNTYDEIKAKILADYKEKLKTKAAPPYVLPTKKPKTKPVVGKHFVYIDYEDTLNEYIADIYQKYFDTLSKPLKTMPYISTSSHSSTSYYTNNYVAKGIQEAGFLLRYEDKEYKEYWHTGEWSGLPEDTAEPDNRGILL